MNGAKLPKKDQLPEQLQELVRRQSFEMRNASFQDDIRKLIGVLNKNLGLALRSRRVEIEAPGKRSLISGLSGSVAYLLMFYFYHFSYIHDLSFLFEFAKIYYEGPAGSPLKRAFSRT